ncbi:MAG: hypothetical protein ABFS39_00080 [Pseudomonadota bacterium]
MVFSAGGSAGCEAGAFGSSGGLTLATLSGAVTGGCTGRSADLASGFDGLDRGCGWTLGSTGGCAIRSLATAAVFSTGGTAAAGGGRIAASSSSGGILTGAAALLSTAGTAVGRATSGGTAGAARTAASGGASRGAAGGVTGLGVGWTGVASTSAIGGGASGSGISHQASKLISSSPAPNSQTPGRCHRGRGRARGSCTGATPRALRSCSARSSASRMVDIANLCPVPG